MATYNIYLIILERSHSVSQTFGDYFMRLLGITVLLSILSSSVIGQTVNRNFCDSNWCKLPKDHEAHFDPYYNGHLCENFDPKQVDFSREYLKLRTRHGGYNELNDLRTVDFSSIWLTGEGQQNGVIGVDYKRIKFHISKVTRHTEDNLVYQVNGKSNVNGNICDFTGQIRLIKAYRIEVGADYAYSGNLFAEYTFYEDKSQNHVGTFQGIFECFFYLNGKNRVAILDESSDIADGYFNRTYVGTWKGYNSTLQKKCIWGDYRLPFTFDFDCGDGEMIACDKYVRNGWTTFNSGDEHEFTGNKAVLIDKWWTKK